MFDRQPAVLQFFWFVWMTSRLNSTLLIVPLLHCRLTSPNKTETVGILDNIHRLKISYTPFLHCHSFPRSSLLIAVSMPDSSGSTEVEVHNDKHIPVSPPSPISFLFLFTDVQHGKGSHARSRSRPFADWRCQKSHSNSQCSRYCCNRSW